MWLGWAGSCGWRRSASFQLITSPLYSMMRSPSAMGCAANTPLPCTAERRVWMRRPAPAAGRVGEAEGGVGDLVGIAEF